MAAVRIVTHHGADDYCLLDWPKVAQEVRAGGSTIVGTTGDLATVSAEIARVEHLGIIDRAPLRDDSGGQGVTVDSFLVGPLRARMIKIESESVMI